MAVKNNVKESAEFFQKKLVTYRELIGLIFAVQLLWIIDGKMD